MLTTKTGRVLEVIPRSNSQTSPLRGGILFLIQECGEGSANLSDLFVRYRARIEGKISRAPEYLDRKRLFLTRRQGLERRSA
jgi:hypothetical protein